MTGGSQTAYVAQLQSHGKPLQLSKVELPAPSANQVLVRLSKTGICHTDVHVVHAEWAMKSPLPLVPGHEGVGTVAQMGSNVTHLQPGQRVCVVWLHNTCQSCDHCISGHENVCNSGQCTGFTIDGTFGTYVLADARYVGKVPDSLTDEQCAPLACAGITAYAAIKNSNAKIGQFIVIAGAAGGLGHLAVRFAKALGLRVIAVASAPHVEFLNTLKPEFAISYEDCTKKILDITGEGAHAVLIFAPNSTLVSEAPNYTRKRGTIVNVGLPAAAASFDPVTLTVKEIVIKGSLVGTRQDLAETLEIAAREKIYPEYTLKPFTQVNQALDDVKNRKVLGRIVLDIEPCHAHPPSAL